MKTFEVKIVGTAPLLMHKFSEEAERSLEAQTKKARKDLGSDEEQAEQVAYRLDNGGLYLPGEAVYQATIKAAVGFKVKGARGKTYKDTAKGNLIVEPDCIPLSLNGNELREYLIDKRRVRVQRNAVMRVRPRLDEWEAQFTARIIDHEALPGEVLNAIFVAAGQAIGLLDYRPRFGRFMLIEFKEQK